MKEIQNRLAAPPDARGRIVSIFVGAVLLPSVALSVLSFNAIPKHVESLRASLLRHAEQLLYYAEQDLEKSARSKALEAARVLGPERLLDGRPREIAQSLREAGLGDLHFETLRLEAWSSTRATRDRGRPGAAEIRALSEVLNETEPRARGNGDDSVLLTTRGGEELGVVRFRFAPDTQKLLVRRFFGRDFVNPQNEWVIRVSDPGAGVLYENAPTRNSENFEVRRVMKAPSLEGLVLELRYRDRSIEQEARRLFLAKTALIAFIDVMLVAGLVLVWANVRRELRLSRLKSDFVANVSHELKTPLALIRLFAETLELGRVPSPDKARQYHGIINKESRRLTQLINNILDFSRIEAGRKEYRFEPGDVSAVVRDVVDAYRFPIEQQGFALELDLAEDLPELPLDAEALSQALINLINNAIKYSPDRKHIRVATSRDGDRILVAVSDQGIGIPKSEHKKIFEKFYRAESSLVHDTKGSGLGLALVRHIVEAHGGEIELTSVPNEGSTFTLVLPLRGVERRVDEPASARTAMAGRLAGSPPGQDRSSAKRGLLERS
jgi:signal transduction histidine kinase